MMGDHLKSGAGIESGAVDNVKLMDEVLKATERVLNPGAHGGEAPLYEKEIEDSIALVKRLETVATAIEVAASPAPPVP
ncbi:hypothetical protein [Panacagrimonas sp.]|uniref:hypothetical protein n=1 Tax=Panacagrimonas sp. TaxID=2480088 RepID=UPI003B52F446